MKKTIRCRVGFALFLLAIAGLVAHVEAAPQEPGVRPLDGWANVFGGQSAALRYACQFEPGDGGKLAWMLSAENHQVLGRGAVDLTDKPGESTVELRFDAPKVRESVVLPVRLSVELFVRSSNQAVASNEKKLWIFPRDPFADRTTWLRELTISLFDPVGKTAKIFDAAKIPYTRLVALPDGDGALKGVLIVGEGLSLADHETVTHNINRLAASGSLVLCLAPSAGRLSLPDASDRPIPNRLSLEDASIIAQLDERLDWRAWPPKGRVASRTLRIAAETGVASAVVTDDAHGWAWLEERYEAGGRLIVCQCEIIERWDVGPTPRFLLAHILERLSTAADTSDRHQDKARTHEFDQPQDDILRP